MTDSTTTEEEVVSEQSPAKRKTEQIVSASSKKARLSVEREEHKQDGSANGVSLSPPPISTSSPLSLTSMPADEDELYSHYVPQHTIKSTINDGVRSCILETCYPPFWDESKGDAGHTNRQTDTPSSSSTSSAPAKTYPFTLDPFQSEAIASLERGQSVLVSAHTSAGKTVVAEYAIAMALRDHQRVIYTSPIKALSNQKYRELFEEFGDVGLMTGDITINPSAGCLVMTTEILRNMLYRGSEVVREVSTIIYDEIHYMRNKERGVVWEETIIMVPHSVRFVFLSATIPNASEFACWIAKLHFQPVNVVYTDYRPTPLQHYLFPSGGDGLYLVVDEKGDFREDNFQKALAVMKAADSTAVPGLSSSSSSSSSAASDLFSPANSKKPNRRNKRGEASDIYKIVKMCMDRNYQPVIVFSFSKRECEQHAQAMSRLDFSDEDERKLIEQIFANAIDSLSNDDKQLPQVTNILPILRRGIGIHHSGLLPLLKEVIEILFQEGLLKCLFSTETFSMGLNMPAKTVVFTSVRKWDGVEFRVVSSGEYIQMSGRAGRRGLDERGIVICMMDEALDPAVAKNMLKGESDLLNSSFHLGYNMLLNLLRVEDQNPMKLMSRSFHQFQATRKTPQLTQQLADKQQQLQELQASLLEPEVTAQYSELRDHIEAVQREERMLWCQPLYVIPFLNPGRLVRVGATASGGKDWGWAALIRYSKKPGSRRKGKRDRDETENDPASYLIDVLVKASASSATTGLGSSTPTPSAQPAAPDEAGIYIIVSIPMTALLSISSIRLFFPKNLHEHHQQQSFGANLQAALDQLHGTIPLLDLIDDMRVKHVDEVKKVQTKLHKLKKQLSQHPWHTSTDSDNSTESSNREQQHRDAALQQYQQIRKLQTEVQSLQQQLTAASSDAAMLQQLQHMQVVLRRLEHTTSNNVIDVKGRVAAEISTCDELGGAELMLNGVFLELNVEVLVAVCSCLVMNEKTDEDNSKKLRAELAAPYRIVQDTVRRIGSIQQEAHIQLDMDVYQSQFSPALMEVVYAWCRGAKFADIMKLTDVFEGTIIRCLRRLEELLRQLGVASKTIGNALLEEKFNAGIVLMKRDIVFAASLYL